MVAASVFVEATPEAFERFFAQEYRRAVSIAYRITRDPAEAEDVAQDVFARCARSRRIATPAWIHSATVHTALNAIRARRRREQREEREFRLTRSAAAGAQDRADPQAVFENRSDRLQVRMALARIPRAHAAILALRYSGLSYREIAQALTIDAAQVGMRLTRAEQALKKEIERETLG